MTEGDPLKLILPFMVPLLIGNVFQQLYNIADIIIVGRTIGVNALADGRYNNIRYVCRTLDLRKSGVLHDRRIQCATG